MNGLKRIFIGRNGVRYGWRFVAFAVAIEFAYQFVERPVLAFVFPKLQLQLQALSAPGLILGEILNLIPLLAGTAVVALLEHRRIDSYGLPLERASGGLFWNGAFLGLGGAIFVALGMLVTGAMRVHGVALHGSNWIVSPLLWLIAMVLVGISEEYLFRGYALQSLWRAAGFWPAALITTALFAGAHVSKPHENALDIGMIFALGIIICLSVRVTGSLWWAVGWHAAFDFGQLFIIGTRNGGQVPVDRLLNVSFPGPVWLTGGELGTEASCLMIPMALGTLLYLMLVLHRRSPKSESFKLKGLLTDA